MPSLSTARLAAFLTLMSFHGDPSTLLKCQDHTCGYAFATTSKPLDLIRGIASGAGASIQSTCPDSNAAVLALGSGIGIVITLSSFGTLFVSQWPLNGINSAFSRGTSVSSFHGPVPDGVFAKVFQSLPVFSHWVGLAIKI